MAMVAGALSPSKRVIDNILIDDPIIVFKCFFNVLKIIILMVPSLLHGDEFAGLQRCGKSCRLRWINYLRPDLKRGTFSQQEENLIIELHAVLGNRYFLLINVIIKLKYVVIN